MSTVGSMSAKAPDLLRLKIRSTFGDVFVEMLSGDTVKDLKDSLKEKENYCDVDYEAKRLRLVFCGRILDDDQKSLLDYGVKSDSTIHAVLSDRVSHGNSTLNDQNNNPENARSTEPASGGISFGGASVVFVDGNTNTNIGSLNLPGGANGMNIMQNLGNLISGAGSGRGVNAGVINLGTQILNLGVNQANRGEGTGANNRNVCTHQLSLKNPDQGWKCGNCNISGQGMTMGCSRCRFFLCVECYAKDVKLAREHSRQNSSNVSDGSSSANSSNRETSTPQNEAKDLSIFQALGHVFNELHVYRREYEAHNINTSSNTTVENSEADNNGDFRSNAINDSSDSDDMYK